MKKKQWPILVLTATAILIATGCHKDVGSMLVDAKARLHITNPDSMANFANRAFRITDSVRGISVRKLIVHRGYQLKTDSTVTSNPGIDVSSQVYNNRLQIQRVVAKGPYIYLNKGFFLKPYMRAGLPVSFRKKSKYGVRLGTFYNQVSFNEEGIQTGLSISLR